MDIQRREARDDSDNGWKELSRELLVAGHEVNLVAGAVDNSTVATEIIMRVVRARTSISHNMSPIKLQ